MGKIIVADKQKTIKKEVKLSGHGLHTGEISDLTFKPAPENTGFVFIRTDLEGMPKIEADALYVISTERGTTLEKKGVRIYTSEHVLAALVGMDVDNCYIQMTGPEPPIMDGSSKYFVKAIEEAGVKEQTLPREYFVIKDMISVSDPYTGSEIVATPSDDYQIVTMVDFGTKVVGTQNATLRHLSEFSREIANARTFVFLHELEQLIDAGLIKGGDINNAIVYVDQKISPKTQEKLKKIFKKDKVSIKPNGILDNIDLHYPNEAARHKLLDVIGDLALIGTRIKGRIFASKPGHSINTQFAKKLAKHIKIAKRKDVPEFNVNINSPVHNINQIKQILPHRYPFLLVDKIIEQSEHHIVGLKNVTSNEPYFIGHFPEEPVMPGVLQVEAMAQVGGILVLSKVEDPEKYSTYFMKIDRVRFKRKVIPGDTLILKMDLLEPIRRGIVHMQGYAYVRDAIVAEAELLAQIVKNK